MISFTYKQWLSFWQKYSSPFKKTRNQVVDIAEKIDDEFLYVMSWIHIVLWFLFTIPFDLTIVLDAISLIFDYGNFILGLPMLIVGAFAEFYLARFLSDLICAAILRFKFRRS